MLGDEMSSKSDYNSSSSFFKICIFFFFYILRSLFAFRRKQIGLIEEPRGQSESLLILCIAVITSDIYY